MEVPVPHTYSRISLKAYYARYFCRSTDRFSQGAGEEHEVRNAVVHRSRYGEGLLPAHGVLFECDLAGFPGRQACYRNIPIHRFAEVNICPSSVCGRQDCPFSRRLMSLLSFIVGNVILMVISMISLAEVITIVSRTGVIGIS